MIKVAAREQHRVNHPEHDYPGPDILVFREGGRMEPFNHTVPYPDPYIPRSLTWEVPGRIRADGSELRRLDDDRLRAIIGELRANAIEAAEQCGVLSIPEVYQPAKLAQVLERWDPARPIVYCDEEAESASPIEASATR